MRVYRSLSDYIRGDPDQTLRSVASDLVLYCLPMSHKKDAKVHVHVTGKAEIFTASIKILLWYLLIRHETDWKRLSRRFQ